MSRYRRCPRPKRWFEVVARGQDGASMERLSRPACPTAGSVDGHGKRRRNPRMFLTPPSDPQLTNRLAKTLPFQGPRNPRPTDGLSGIARLRAFHPGDCYSTHPPMRTPFG